MEQAGGRSCSPKMRKVEEEIRTVYSGKEFSSSDKQQRLEELKTISQQTTYLAKLKSQREQLQQLREQFQSKEEQLAQKDRVIEKLRLEVISLSQIKLQFDRLIIRAEKDRFELERVKAERDQYRDQIARIEKQNLREQNQILRRQIIEHKARTEDLQNQLSYIVVVGQTAQKEREAETKRSIEVIHQLKFNLAGLKDNCQGLASRLKQAQQQNDRLTQYNINREGQISQLLNSLYKCKQVRSQLEDTISALRRRQVQLLENIQSLKNQSLREVDVLHFKINESEKLIKKLQKQVSEAKIKQKNYQASELSSDKYKETLKKQLEQQKKLRIGLEVKSDHLEQQRGRLVESVKILNQKLNELQSIGMKEQVRRQDQKKIGYDVQRMRHQLQTSCMFEVQKIDSLIDSINARRRK